MVDNFIKGAAVAPTNIYSDRYSWFDERREDDSLRLVR